MSDYYPFGFAMGGRSVSSGEYRYGFNGKEKDSNGEWGNQTHYDYGFRIYNPGIGKFLSVDPLTREFPFYTPYQFAGNTPIIARDIDGLEPVVEDGYLVVYIVKKGQGPTQIFADLNDPKTQKKFGYTLQKKVTWEKIVLQNISKFQNVVDGDGEIIDKRNGDYRWGNIKPNDFLFINNGEKPENNQAITSSRKPKASNFQNILRDLATHIDDEALLELMDAFGVRTGRGGLVDRWEDASEIIHEDNFEYGDPTDFFADILDALRSAESEGAIEITTTVEKIKTPTIGETTVRASGEDEKYKEHTIVTIKNAKNDTIIRIDTTTVEGQYKIYWDTTKTGPNSYHIRQRYEDERIRDKN